MAIAYENGVNLFDTAEVYASGRSDSTSPPQCFSPYDSFVDFLFDLIRLCSDVKFNINLTINIVLLNRAEITLGNIIKKKGWR